MTVDLDASKERTEKRTRWDARSFAQTSPTRYLLTHRRLLMRVTRSDLGTRYAGSLLGWAWALLTPALILALYATVYLVIFPFEPPGLSNVEYVLYIFCGLAPFLTLSEAISVGVGSVTANKAVLSNVIFPIDLVPVKAVLTAQAPTAVGFAVLLAGTAATGRLSWTVLLVPVVWLLFAAGLVGLTWVLSLLNIVFRDLQNLTTAILMMLLIASPFAYTPEMVPTSLKWLLYINPFAYFVIAFQRLWVLGVLPTPAEAIVLVVISVASFVGGAWFFKHSKRVLIDYV